MAIQTSTGTFLIASTDVATTVLQIRGVGFQGKALILFWSGRTDATSAAGGASHTRGIGFATGTANRGYQTTQSTDAVATTQSDIKINTDACVATLTLAAASAVDGLADFSAWDADGFDIIIDDQFSANLRVSYFVIGGDSITDATVQTYQEATGTPPFTMDITNAGFQPDFIMDVINDSSALSGLTTDSRYSVGAATASGQWVAMAASNDGATTTQTQSLAHDSAEVSNSFGASITGPGHRLEFVTFLSNGFRLNNVETSFGYHHIYLALKGGNYTVGNNVTSTGTGDNPITGIGYKPAGGLIISTNKAENTVNISSEIDQFSIGAFSSASQQVAHASRDNDATVGSEVSTAIDYAASYINLDSTGAIQGKGSVTAIGSDGFTFTMSDGDPVASWFGYIAFGPAAAGEISGNLAWITA
jgi:hypothetical protein